MKIKETWAVAPRVTLAAVVLFLAFSASAVTSTVEVKVTVVAPPPCTINDNQSIDVDFGSNIIANKVDGSEYLKTVEYNLDCQNGPSNAMKLSIRGNSTTFNTSALQTNINDFGIALRANGQPLVINDWIKFTYPDKPVLQAVPVKKAGATLTGGDFSAGATLMVYYQ
ncbi:fimbrial protein [Erwinia tasmaniensis]|uniref:MrfE protein n=1 Tax=Erwinia tasmaniensis (strain DSM 17950 / CFBP 7177 / CIP 109463 / NCPPB 4357 / Et1/99) TaxID=465817 RepID=B2VGY8_ERWT9|nr:fimbrial protein [Erwinia tasmaniensis]CAO95310.1 MrfE protein [Erwinia tasmaniensis Et1/99]